MLNPKLERDLRRVLVMKSTQLILLGLAALTIECHQVTDSPATEPIVMASQPNLPWVKYTLEDVLVDTTTFTKPEAVAVFDDSSLDEASGLAHSERNPGYLWTQADSGNSNEIFLVRRDGKIAAQFTIDGANNRDWEEIAVGPGPVAGQSYIYLADIGDNRLYYPKKIIYRFPEPLLHKATAPYSEHVLGADRLVFQLPDGPKNAEAILVDPKTRDIYILSKEEQCVVYRATYPQSVSKTTVMQRALAIPFRVVTAADISRDGHDVLIRTYTHAFYYTRQEGESVIDALKRTPLLEPLAQEPQGEAISWATDKSGYYTVSEEVNWWTPQVVYFCRRKR